MYAFIRFETGDGVGELTLNRPDVLNSFHLDMAREVQDALGQAVADDAIRAVLLTGAGRGFCAGQDLAAVPLGDDVPLPDLAETVRAQYNPIVRVIREIPKPVVCAVNGVAAGAGANLAFACDIVLASTEASFIQSFSRIGLVPDSGGTFFLPRLVGLARASGLALLGDRLSALQARDWGLIWDVVEPAALLSRAREVARYLATQPTKGLGLTKELLNASLQNDLDAQLEFEARLQAEAGWTDDFLEGVRAFREKRKPVFRGR
ncbi:MAG TPA: 2-(1,2-epoxy-1,2-dihydrophenyl)acetyl-CoA isomerase PaaG [Gemmatimonadaceae bacterium]|nr:2-(1,2-epoxy-1,2-dihydrophenyl)acetyl-CoA isomerase PaaG [Gemmatimonadaceae bacterium]